MLLKIVYKICHANVSDDEIPYWWKRSVLSQIWHTIRKWICQVLAPNCTITFIRVNLYRLCGFKIGKGSFIGMKCYLDDLCVDKMCIGENCTVSYGVYFACHGRHQGYNKIEIKDGAYVGMRVSIIAPKDIEIGENSIIGAMSLVNKSVPAGCTAVGVPCRILG